MHLGRKIERELEEDHRDNRPGARLLPGGQWGDGWAGRVLDCSAVLLSFNHCGAESLSAVAH